MKAPVYCTMKPVTAGPMMPAQLAIMWMKPPTPPMFSPRTVSCRIAQ